MHTHNYFIDIYQTQYHQLLNDLYNEFNKFY